MNKIKESKYMPFNQWLALLLIYLKCVEEIEISWLWVISPIWIVMTIKGLLRYYGKKDIDKEKIFEVPKKENRFQKKMAEMMKQAEAQKNKQQ